MMFLFDFFRLVSKIAPFQLLLTLGTDGALRKRSRQKAHLLYLLIWVLSCATFHCLCSYIFLRTCFVLMGLMLSV